MAGSEVNISGGSIGSSGLASSSAVNISGGSVGDDFEAGSFSEVSISGGSVGNDFTARPASAVNISGGSVGNSFRALGNTEINISGGTVGEEFDAAPNSEINLFGSDFFLDGVPLDGLPINDAFRIFDRNVTLSGLLADGSAFTFDLNPIEKSDEDYFDPRATLTVTLVPEPDSLAMILPALSFLGLFRRR